MEQYVERTRGPLARGEGLLIQDLEGETLVYDRERHQAHCLNGPAAILWRACDGTRTVTDLQALLAEAYPGSDAETVHYALRQLQDRHLLEAMPSEPDVEPPHRMTRREIVRKLAVGGLAAGLAIPVVRSIVAPTPAHAFSCRPSGSTCSSSAQCCSGVCIGGHCL